MDLITETDYCGLVSGRDADKSGVFDLFYGELETAPMIVQCPICIECKLLDVVPLPSHNLFLGEIMATYTDQGCLTGGQPDVEKIMLAEVEDSPFIDARRQVPYLTRA